MCNDVGGILTDRDPSECPLIEELPAKRNTRNQKQFEKLLVMQYENIKLTVGLQRSNQDLVQYCITIPQIPIQNKAISSEE